MGKGILSAVKTVFKGIPDFICHFHFLRDVGKDLFEEEYAIIRKRLKTHKIRALLRRKAKELGKNIEDDLQAVDHLSAVIENGCVDGKAVDKMAAYAMVHWIFDKSELEDYGFPFDCPHLIFYQRLKKLSVLVLPSAGAIKKEIKPMTSCINLRSAFSPLYISFRLDLSSTLLKILIWWLL